MSGDARAPLYLLFRLGGDGYALPARAVAAVLPLPALKQLPEAPAWVAGLHSHRGERVPVIDLQLRASGRHAAPLNSTRLVIVDLPAPGAAAPRRLGLILEQATNTFRCADDQFRDNGIDPGPARYLGPTAQTPFGLVQRVEVTQLLPPDVRALLFPDAPGGEAPCS